ncbi:conserved Plasmodium protein, unknown function [Plasmodium gallinaceum]|uniref:Uncharacterized protein n=1 Tax=Plasmodium gallinaceum TaxID=5849 RepID=A0A1J1GQH8_PLAGA|nr:conserved Plasmodium protein, unknown function [Plasmodium gallinaceum]CRG94707.1 conserved Plasmodium protein, unknown function [Plasmodium gallinaceum]
MRLKNEKMNNIKNNFKSDSTGFIITESQENHNEEYETNISELREDKRRKKKKINANDDFSDNLDLYYSSVLKNKKIKSKENKVKINTVKSSENFYDCIDSNYISENKLQKQTNKISKKKELHEINKDINENSNSVNDNNVDKEKNTNEMLLKDNTSIDKKMICSNLNENDQVIMKKRKSKKNPETKIEKKLKKTRKEYIKKYKYKNGIEYNENKKSNLFNNNIKKNDMGNILNEFSMNNNEKNTNKEASDFIDKINTNENNETCNKKKNLNLDNVQSNEKPYYCSNTLENELLADTSEKTLNSYCNIDVDNSTESILGSISKSNNNYDNIYVNNEVRDSKSEEFINLVKVDYNDNKKKKEDIKNFEGKRMEDNINTEIPKIGSSNNVINDSTHINTNLENKDDLISQTNIPPVVEKKKRGRKRKIQKNLEFLSNTYKKTNNENVKLPKIYVYKKERKNESCNNQLFELNDDKYISNNLCSYDKPFSIRKNVNFGHNNNTMQTRRKSKDVKIKDEKYSPYADYIYNKNGGKRKYTKRKYKKKYMASSTYPTDISNNTIKYKNNKMLENRDKRLFPNETFMNKEEFMNHINNINTIFNFNEEFLKFLSKVSKCKDIDYDSMLSFLGDIQIKLSENIHEEFSNEIRESHNVNDTIYAMNYIVDILNNNNEILSKLNQLEYKFYYDYLKNKLEENKINGNLNEIKKKIPENNSSNNAQSNNEWSESLQKNNIDSNKINKEDYAITNEMCKKDEKINECSFSKDNLSLCDIQNNKILINNFNYKKDEIDKNNFKNNISSMNNENGFKCNKLCNEENDGDNNNNNNNDNITTTTATTTTSTTTTTNNNNNNDNILGTINSESSMQNNTDLINTSKIILNDLHLNNTKLENIENDETDNFNKNDNDKKYDITKKTNNIEREKNYFNNNEYKNESLYKINYQNNIDFVCDELNKLIKETLKNECLFYSKYSKTKYENVSEKILYKNYISTKLYKNNNLTNRRNEDICLKYPNDPIYENKEDNNFLKKYIEFFKKVNYINSKSKLYDNNDNMNSKSTMNGILNANNHFTKDNINDNGHTLSEDKGKMNDFKYVLKCKLNDERNLMDINKSETMYRDENNKNIMKNYVNEQGNINNNISTSGNSKNIECHIKENDSQISNELNKYDPNLILNVKVEKNEKDDDNEKNKECESSEQSKENNEDKKSKNENEDKKKDNLTNISNFISFFKIKTGKNEERENVEKIENSKNNETKKEKDIIDKNNTNILNQGKEGIYSNVNENSFIDESNEKKEIDNLKQENILMQDNFLKNKYNDTMLTNNFGNTQNDELKYGNTLKNDLSFKVNDNTESNFTNNNEKKTFLDDKKKFNEYNYDTKNSIVIENNYKGDNDYITNISQTGMNIKNEKIVCEKEDLSVNKDLKKKIPSENYIFHDEINGDQKIEYDANIEEKNIKIKNVYIVTNNSVTDDNDKKNLCGSFLLKEEFDDNKTKYNDNISNENNFSKLSKKENDTMIIYNENKESIDCCNLNVNNRSLSDNINMHNKETITSLLKETFDLKYDEIINVKTDKSQKEILDCLSMISKIKKVFFDECTKMINNQIYLLEKNFRIPNCSLSILKNSFGYNSNK